MSPSKPSLGQSSETNRPLVRGVRPQRPTRKRAPLDPTTPGSGAGNFPNMLYQGGPVINNPQVYIVFLGDWTSSANQTRATRLQQFVTDLVASSYMNILSQYGCGSSGTVVNAIFLANTITSLTHANIATLLQNAINSGTPATHLPEPAGSDVCIIYLDDSTAVDDTVTGAVMCEATSDTAFGYHSFFTTTAGNPFYFAIVPGLTDACLTNSCPGSDSTCTLHLAQTQEQRQTAVSSHEFSEMISDPQITGTVAASKLAWYDGTDPSAGEIGDVCAGNFGTITAGANTWTVQLMFSKLDDQQSNGATTCVASEAYPLPSLLPAVTLILDRSTFGRDEVNSMLSAGKAVFADAFYVVVSGFTPDELGLTASNLDTPPNLPTFSITSGPFSISGDPGFSFDSSTGVQLEQPGQFWNIQRITYPYNIKFLTVNAFSGLSASNETKIFPVSATIANTVTPAGYPSLSATSLVADFELVFQADPFMSAGETWWLSNDIRVFQVTPANLPASKVPLAYSSTAYSTPNAYIKALLNELNTSFTSPTTANTPFNGISADEDQSALNLTGEDLHANPVVNFALARVHLLGDTASNVRTFFRLFISSSPDTTFNTSTTFRSGIQTDSSGNSIPGTLIPLLGDITSDMPSTIPFFAEPRIDTTAFPLTHQSDPSNVQTIPSPLISPPPTPGQEVYAYFGCWLDLNQSTGRFPLNPAAQPKPDGPYSSSAILSIPALIMSNHACIVAEISYDPDPIPPAANASTSDKLGQRNLSWSPGDNPGPQDSHRIPTLFDLRPTSSSVPQNVLTDELMIEWGNTPAGSIASIYWPQLSADEVLGLASRFYASKVLTKKDANTIQCVTGAVTYIPIPRGTGSNLAGLLTVDLPLTVRVGQQFNIVVRRLTSRFQNQSYAAQIDRATSDLRNWRYVVGVFQIRIPVSTGAVLLKPEESLLALFKWKLESIPHTNRWHAVLRRYVQQVSGRVDGFGGSAGSVGPSQNGAPGGVVGPGSGKSHDVEREEFTGKVAAVTYDRFGDFESFTLITERGHDHYFRSREREIERIVRYAWEERSVISVFTDKHRPQLPVLIVLRRSAKGFWP